MCHIDGVHWCCGGPIWQPSWCSCKCFGHHQDGKSPFHQWCCEIKRGWRPVHFTTWQTPRLLPQPHLFQIRTSGSIQVSGFRFCHNHDNEMCHTCCCNYRMTNNICEKTTPSTWRLLTSRSVWLWSLQARIEAVMS